MGVDASGTDTFILLRDMAGFKVAYNGIKCYDNIVKQYVTVK